MLKTKYFISLILFLPGICSILALQAQNLKTYPIPNGVPQNNDFSVKVRLPDQPWEGISLYQVKVAKQVNFRHQPRIASMGYFDFESRVEVSVTFNKGDIHSVRIRPAVYRISPKVTKNKITFSLPEPRNLSIEINGNQSHNLHLFTNSLEKNIPDSTDENTVYFGPGIHIPPDSLDGMFKIHNGQTVYIAGGAVVKGGFSCDSVEDVKIIGRGIIYNPPEGVVIKYSRNIEVGGVIFVDPDHYTITSGESKGVYIHDIKSFSYKGWGDGIDVFCSTNVKIDGVFMRNSDDCIAIYGHRWNYYGNTQDISVTNSTLWADVAHPINIGTHGDTAHPDTLSNMVFSNINILQQDEPQIDYQGCMAINAGDENLVKDIRFENIHIDQIKEGQLVNLRVMYNHKYNTAPGRGIENIYFKNITYNGPLPNLSIITGYNSTRYIKNIVFENLRLNGRLIYDKMPEKPGYYKTADMARFFVGAHVEPIKFISTVPESH